MKENKNMVNQKSTNSQLLILLESTAYQQEFYFTSELFFFLLQYSFLFKDNDKTQKTCTLKTTHFHIPQGNGEKGARYLDPKYSRWISTDPALGEYVPAAGKGNASDAGNLPGMGGIYNSVNGNLYHYAGNNPVKYVDPDGRFPFPVFPIRLRYLILKMEYNKIASRNDELGFAARNPIVAADMYPITGHNITNIGTNSVRFACALSLNERKTKGSENEGSQVNAVRHTLWSASITAKYGDKIAKEATDSHEHNLVLTGTVFNDSLSADSRVDSLNNEIGIKIGKISKTSDMKILTSYVLNYYYKEGLWVTDQNSDGTWYIRKEKLSEQQYNEALKQLKKCDSNGFN